MNKKFTLLGLFVFSMGFSAISDVFFGVAAHAKHKSGVNGDCNNRGHSNALDKE